MLHNLPVDAILACLSAKPQFLPQQQYKADALHATASDATQRGAAVDGGITTYSQDEEGRHTTTSASEGTNLFTYTLKSAQGRPTSTSKQQQPGPEVAFPLQQGLRAPLQTHSAKESTYHAVTN